MHKTRFGAVILLYAGGISGCNTTASQDLVVAIENYDARSIEAIAALEKIEAKVVEQPAVSDSESERRFVDEALEDGVIVTEDVMEELLHPNARPPRRSPGLAEMRCGHGRFKASFAQVGEAGIFGKKPVATYAPGVLDSFVAQQLAMARMIQNNPQYVRLLVRRAAVGAELTSVLEDTKTSKEDKEEALIDLRKQLLAIEEEEAQLRATALEDLLKAAATGIALREQMEKYGQWSLSDLTDSLGGLTSFIGKVTGRDFAALNGRIDELEGQIAGDPRLVSQLEQALAAIPVPEADGSFAETATDRRPAGRTSGTSATPCLDTAPVELPDPVPPPQPETPAAEAAQPAVTFAPQLSPQAPVGDTRMEG